MGEDNNYRLIEILLVEDNPADVRLTKEALREGRILNRLNVVKDGMEALSFLRREGEHSSSPRPDLILLDLNLPRKDGREVLAEINPTFAIRGGREPEVLINQCSHIKGLHYKFNLDYWSTPPAFDVIWGGGCGGKYNLRRLSNMLCSLSG